MPRREHQLLQAVPPEELDRDEVARCAAVDEAASPMPVHDRVNAKEDASVRSGRGVVDGENMVLWPLVRRRARRSLRQEGAKAQERSFGSVSGDGLDARCVGHRRRHAHAAALRHASGAPCVERLGSVVDMSARLRAVEADCAGCRCRRRCEAVGGGGGVGDGLRERCERVGVACERRCCGAMRWLDLFVFLFVFLRCDWMIGFAGPPVGYRAVAIDGMALSRSRAEWPSRAD